MHDVLQDVFYLTVEELFAFVDGRAVTNDIAALVELRKREYDGYRKVGGLCMHLFHSMDRIR